MSKKLAFERYYWFHNRVKQHAYPNASSLADKFEVSTKTAQRDIDFIINRLIAPLKYDRSRRGYIYTDKGFELPPLWTNAEEWIALILTERIATAIPNRLLKQSLRALLEKFSFFSDVEIKNLERKISLLNVVYYRVDENIFSKVIVGLMNESKLQITYHSPYTNETTQRKIAPLHLLNYMGNWHLISYCVKQKGIRMFTLSRIKECSVLDDELGTEIKAANIKKYMRKNFGLFAGKTNYTVKVKFLNESARVVQEQIWHKSQKLRVLKDGSVILEIPVADLKEIKREILSFGSNAEVLEPLELRKEIQLEAEKIKEKYI